jgi:hypothetical protein
MPVDFGRRGAFRTRNGARAGQRISYVAYTRSYRRTHTWPHRHGPNFGLVSALLVALFGIALLVIMFMFTD